MTRKLEIPSPKPKQGIKLSSSKGAKVFPIIEMAFSYGLGVLPIACRLRLLKEIFPVKIKSLHWLVATAWKRYWIINDLVAFFFLVAINIICS